MSVKCTDFFNTSIDNSPASNRTEYVDHCIDSVLMTYALGQYIACSWRYKCSEPSFVANITSFSVASAGSGAATRLCVPHKAGDPNSEYEEYTASTFFLPLSGKKIPTDRQYEQMVTELHMSVWGHPDCPGARRRRVAQGPPPRTTQPDTTSAP
jgi:hypothetical protein